jgi:hypothetical protein
MPQFRSKNLPLSSGRRVRRAGCNVTDIEKSGFLTGEGERKHSKGQSAGDVE